MPGPGWKTRSERRVIGKDQPRLDGPPKATGRAKYAYDINLPGLLQGRILRCPHASATVESIDSSGAEKMPGVKAVIITAKPGEQMRYAGQQIGAVAAVTCERAEDAIRAIKVKYKVLPHAVHESDAMKPGAPKVRNEGNVSNARKEGRGDVDAALRAAKYTNTATYSVAVRLHASLETHGVTCRWDDDKHLTCWASTQGVFSVRDGLVAEFKLPAENVTVITEFMGGGFGSKFGAGYEGTMCARLAQKAGAPVKLMLTREEEHIATGNAPSATATITLGANEDGKIVAYDAKGHGTGGIAGAGVPMPYIYDVGATRVEQVSVYTNAGPQAAWRAPGHSQASFLMESAIDDLATKIGIDPLEMRLKNDSHAVRRMEWAEGARLIGWERRNKAPGVGELAGTGRFKRGLGCGGATWGSYGGPGSQCRVVISRDGTVSVEIGVQDIGTGTRTYCATVVAEELGIPASKVRPNIGKTTLGYGVASGGSVTTGSTAPALKRAAEAARMVLFQKVAPKLDAQPEDLIAEDGRIRTNRGVANAMSFDEACSLLGMAGAVGNGTWDRDLVAAAPAGAQFAEVEVDTETGHVQVIKMVALQDGGIVLNPLTFTSQVNGGVIQGLGMALLEDRRMCQLTGRMVNPNLEDYRIPGTMEMPEFVSVAFEAPDAKGVTGIGEPPVIPPASAIRNAILNATGAHVNEAPMTPGRVLAALAAAKGRSHA